jgi:hypothetical protein
MCKKDHSKYGGKLEQMVLHILDRSPDILMIINLGVYSNDIIFLYILIENDRYQLNYNLNELMEADCKSVMNLFTVIEKINLSQDDDFDGKAFLQFAKKVGQIIYSSNGSTLSDVDSALRNYADTSKDKIREHFKYQMNAFLAIANQWEKEKEYTTALYFMHCSIEAALLGMLCVSTGYRTFIPNLNRLIKMTLLLTDDIHNLFTPKNADDEYLLQSLGKIYPIENRSLLKIKKSEIILCLLKIGELIRIIKNIDA